MFLHLNWLDYCFIGLISFSTLMGFMRGFVQELSSLANWILGLWSGFVFYEPMSFRLPEVIQPIEVRYVLGFFIVLGIVVVTVAVLSKSVSWMITSIGLKGPDSLLGVFFGGLRGILLVGLFILVAKASPLLDSKALQYSALIPYFEPLEYWLEGIMPDQLSSQKLSMEPDTL